MPQDKHNPTNKKFFNAVRALQSKDIDPESVSKDVVQAARRSSRSEVEKKADSRRDLGRPRRDEPRVKLKSAERKVKEEAVSPANTDSLNLISTYSNYGKALRQAENLIEIGMHIDDIINVAEQIVLGETNDWFDENTVKRNVKEMKAHSKDFVKTVTEAQRLMERAQALYDDMGVKLNRYFDMEEASDGHGVEDDASTIANNKKPKTFDVLNMKEENDIESNITSSKVGINTTNTETTVGNPTKRENALRSIIATKTHKLIDGVMIDRFTATSIMNILNSLSKEENRIQFLSMPIDKMVDYAVKLNK